MVVSAEKVGIHPFDGESARVVGYVVDEGLQLTGFVDYAVMEFLGEKRCGGSACLSGVSA